MALDPAHEALWRRLRDGRLTPEDVHLLAGLLDQVRAAVVTGESDPGGPLGDGLRGLWSGTVTAYRRLLAEVPGPRVVEHEPGPVG